MQLFVLDGYFDCSKVAVGSIVGGCIDNQVPLSLVIKDAPQTGEQIVIVVKIYSARRLSVFAGTSCAAPPANLLTAASTADLICHLPEAV